MRSLVRGPKWPAVLRVRGEVTPARVLRLVGRVAVWAVIALLLLRGAADVMAGEPAERDGSSSGSSGGGVAG